MPDLAFTCYVKKNWLILVEAVTSHGPVSPKRLRELKDLFVGIHRWFSFPNCIHRSKAMVKYLPIFRLKPRSGLLMPLIT